MCEQADLIKRVPIMFRLLGWSAVIRISRFAKPNLSIGTFRLFGTRNHFATHVSKPSFVTVAANLHVLHGQDSSPDFPAGTSASSAPFNLIYDIFPTPFNASEASVVLHCSKES